MAFSCDDLLANLRNLPVPETYWVALSGGLDSVVLLNALSRIRSDLPAPIKAIHVNHGLQNKALKWEQFCRETCARLDIPFTHLQINLRPASGESLEAQAREARYAAIARRMGAGDMLLTAHHGDDQVETFLLQLLRGAGVSGLASMPLIKEWEQGWLARPLLDFSREELRAWAQEQQLHWQEDPSNQRLAIRRNYLRHKILPLLREQWPGIINTTGRSARHCAEAASLMREVGVADLQQTAGQNNSWTLSIRKLQQLSYHRQKNLLRYWIRHQGLPVPGHRVIERILTEVMLARQVGSPLLQWNSGEIRRYRGKLYLMPGLPPLPEEGLALHWRGEKPLGLPQGLGVLKLSGEAGWLQAGVEVLFRSENLKCRPGNSDAGRSFKRLCQDLGIPPWIRPRIPLIYHDGNLVAVGDYCLCQPARGDNPIVWERAEWLR